MPALRSRPLFVALLLTALRAGATPCTDDGHDWMGQLAQSHAEAWARAPFSALLIPGSHDAGTYGTPSRLSILEHEAQTQSDSLRGQLCRGSRWFDLRLKQHKGEWHVFHSAILFATEEAVLQDILSFADDPAHRYEVAIVRLKLEARSFAAKEALLRKWMQRLGAHLVKPGERLSQMTLAELGSTPDSTGARIALMIYDKDNGDLDTSDPAHPVPFKDDVRSQLFKYRSHQAGDFADKVAAEEIVSGQQARLRDWKSDEKKSPAPGRLFGLWWTSTGAFGHFNVRHNAELLWRTGKANPRLSLDAFIKSNQCQVGNVLIVDFYGDNAVSGTKGNHVLELAREGTKAHLEQREMSLCAK